MVARTTRDGVKNLEAEGFLQPGRWRSVPNALAPARRTTRWCDESTVERGFSFPPSDFFMEILKVYGLQPHNISPNSVLAISNHVTLCEGHLRVTPELSLFQYYFSVKKEKVRQSTELATCGSITFMIRPGRVYPHTDRHESARYWSGGFFYLKDVSDPASTRKLPTFKNCPATELPAWSHCPHLSDSPQLTRAVRRICKLTEEGAEWKDLTLSWFTKRIQPLQHRDQLMFQYTGRDDPMRATKDNLSADAIDKRIRVLIKTPRELHVHVCNKDIHMNGSGTALEALEESELGTLLRVPSTGNTDPKAASEAEARDAPRPAKRKRAAPSSPSAKRARDVLSIAATHKAEAEKKRLKLIDTSNRAQSDIHQFFRPSGSESQPPKAPKAPKKKSKPSPATIPSHRKSEFHPRLLQWPSLILRTSSMLTISLKIRPSGLRKAIPARVPLHLLLRLNNPPVLPPSQRPNNDGNRRAALTAESSRQAVLRLEARLKAPHHRCLIRQGPSIGGGDESLKNFLKESSEKETKEKKELSEKHAHEMAELADKLKKSHQRVTTLAAKNKSQEAEAEAIDKLIFPSLGFEWTKDSTLTRTEAYDEARTSIVNLVEACRGIAQSLNLKKAKTTVIDRMTKLMQNVPELIKDWQESSSRGVASLVLATCKAHFPTMNFADVACGVHKDTTMRQLLSEAMGFDRLFAGRVNHSFWYNKYDLPEGFSDPEEEEEAPRRR
ncbi:hypothetical protein QYE76_014205 [Lolium multiflorum]|uniref:Transposase (putative) gypsy type domain-containing protein n=1 Tax=Lolium multiflorum TaxID=4521 RepID=A0AAD8U437_LOLMU|nr:hypothetical protein QYE76_014205 [Lolium multiflorum]